MVHLSPVVRGDVPKKWTQGQRVRIVTEEITEAIRRNLLLGQLTDERPLSERSPIPYHWIPGRLRILLAKIVFQGHVRAMREDVGRRPQSYLDNTTDQLARHLAPNTGTEPVWRWPEGRRCALVLSHDTDTGGQERGISILLDVASRWGMPSTFSFVGRYLDGYGRFLGELKDRGVEVALHDLVHDNQIAFLDQKAIIDRLSPLAKWQAQLGIEGFRSPSWYCSPVLWHSLEQLGFLYDMSALDTWPFFSRGANHGVASWFPFIVDGLVVIPNTIPFELPWFCGYNKRDTLNFWKPKFDAIAHAEGLIMFNAHPDPWYCGNQRAAECLAACLDYIIETHDPALMSARQVAKHALAMARDGAMLQISGHPSLMVPRLEREPERFRIGIEDHRNPCLVPRRNFLKGSYCP